MCHQKIPFEPGTAMTTASNSPPLERKEKATERMDVNGNASDRTGYWCLALAEPLLLKHPPRHSAWAETLFRDVCPPRHPPTVCRVHAIYCLICSLCACLDPTCLFYSQPASLAVGRAPTLAV